MRKYLAAVVLGILVSPALFAADLDSSSAPEPALEPALDAILLTPPPPCGPVTVTPTRRGGGSTCAQATSAVQATLIALANCGSCGFCTQQFSYGACEAIQGGYSVPAYLRYSCQICDV